MSSSNSMAFRNAVVQDFGSKQLGENGMPEYTTAGIGSNVLGVSQMVRGADVQPLVRDILNDGTANDVADLFILMFVTRNTRGGKGEKKLSFDIFLKVWNDYPETAKKLLRLFPHYGYWKDLLLLMSVATEHANRDLIQQAMTIMREQFIKDCAALQSYKASLATAEGDELATLQKAGPSFSLLCKWLPREKSSFDNKIGFVDKFVAVLLWPEDKDNGKDSMYKARKRYRQTVAEMTSFLDLPEVLLAVKREDEIRFSRVASKATMRLRKVFLNETKTGERRSEDVKRIRLAERFKEHMVRNGLKGAQLQPHEIVQKVLKGTISRAEELVLDAQWKDLWRNVKEEVEAAGDEAEFNPTQMIPLADVSGSMHGVPIQVAIALAIGISEITHPAFQNMVLTFTARPQFHLLNPTDTIVQKVRSLARAPWGMNTNFEAAYDLILATAKEHKLAREEVPALIVFSDMQFDYASGCRYGNGSAMATMHDVIRAKFKATGNLLGWEDKDPTPMIYWNLRNTGGHPVAKDTEGAVLLSGFSPSLLKLVMRGEALKEQEIEVVQADGTVVTEKVRVTPEEILRKMLDDELYDPVREILVSSREGKLLEYEIPLAPMRQDGEDFEMVADEHKEG